jgi:hypothetical protein
MNISQMNVVELAPMAVRTSTLTGSGFDLSAYSGFCHVILQSSAATVGTNPTLNVKLQHCDTSGGSYEDITGAAFTQVTNAADTTQMITIKPDELKPYVKVIGTIGGTSTPTFGFGVSMVGCLQSGRNSSQAV